MDTRVVGKEGGRSSTRRCGNPSPGFLETKTLVALMNRRTHTHGSTVLNSYVTYSHSCPHVIWTQESAG